MDREKYSLLKVVGTSFTKMLILLPPPRPPHAHTPHPAPDLVIQEKLIIIKIVINFLIFCDGMNN
jgi:hypothetical protein